MATDTKTAIAECKECIDTHTSFVLRGGAGSGKTESLKELLLYIQKTKPSAKVVCITYTNAAVDEIVNRVGDQYLISTIHAFLYNLIGNYKSNIKAVIGELFYVPLMVRGQQEDGVPDTVYKKTEHEKYKTIYKKYAKVLFSICRENADKECGKREYDKNPEHYNELLNNQILELNKKIAASIEEKKSTDIYYNETKFDRFRDLSYGHDGLLNIFHWLFQKYPLLGRIIADRYDFIFIDEYQDTHAEVLSDLLTLPTAYGITIALFGDSMQSIYEDGVGDVEEYVKNLTLKSIPKADNYRCSYEVIKVLDSLRIDEISQSVALKRLPSGQLEASEDRHGLAKVIYTVVDAKPSSRSPEEEKEQYRSLVDHMIFEAQRIAPDSKILILTNKAIAEKNGFPTLYRTFSDRYSDIKDQIENYLRSIQVLDIGEICNMYLHKDFNSVIKLVQKGGFSIHTVADKTKLHDIIQGFVDDTNLSVKDAVENAITFKLMKQSEALVDKISSNEHFLDTLKQDALYPTFKDLYLAGKNTFARIKDSIEFHSEEEFKEYQRRYEKERFILAMRSCELKFCEVLNYVKYLNEETEYITMHKTKGTSIPSVIVVMEEYFWNDYDFSLLYKDSADSNQTKKEASQKLIYVACSRAQKNLIALKILTNDEVDAFKNLFPNAEFIQIALADKTDD